MPTWTSSPDCPEPQPDWEGSAPVEPYGGYADPGESGCDNCCPEAGLSGAIESGPFTISDGAFRWRIPTCRTIVTIELWGTPGRGNVDPSSLGADGGGGGGYAQKTFETEASVYGREIVIGAESDGSPHVTAGESDDPWYCRASGTDGRPGASAAYCVGDFVAGGGDGGLGATATLAFEDGGSVGVGAHGGGGGAGGPTGDGGPGGNAIATITAGEVPEEFTYVTTSGLGGSSGSGSRGVGGRGSYSTSELAAHILAGGSATGMSPVHLAGVYGGGGGGLGDTTANIAPLGNGDNSGSGSWRARITWRGFGVATINGASGSVNLRGEDGIEIDYDQEGETSLIIIRDVGLDIPVKASQGGFGADVSGAEAGTTPTSQPGEVLVFEDHECLWFGAGPPDDSIGRPGDMYRDLTSGLLYGPKT